MAKNIPDLCVIGGGSGGLVVAAATAALGGDVVLIEGHKMGGDCLNYGCVPSKAIIAAAKQAALMRGGEKFGIVAVEPEIDFKKVHNHIHRVISTIAPHDSVERFEGLGVKVIQGYGQFIAPNKVQINDEIIRAKRFVIATGSSAFIPPIEGLDKVKFETNETIFNLKKSPEHLLIAGGGPIGMELAQAHCRLGAKVTVLEMSNPLGRDDQELTQFALEQIQKDGVHVRAKTKLLKVDEQAGHIVATIANEDDATQIIKASHLLVATGRTPKLEGLGLDKANVEHDRFVKVDQSLRTSNKRIYAIGDVIGGLQFTHMAGYHAGLVVRHALLGLPVRTNDTLIPRATYTDPEIAQVGMTEKDARQIYGGNINVLRWPYKENDRAQTERKTQGLIKIITRTNGTILGAGIVGANAGDQINIWAFAMANKLKIGAFMKFVVAYPTLTEISKRAATTFYTPKLNNPILHFIRKIRRVLS